MNLAKLKSIVQAELSREAEAKENLRKQMIAQRNAERGADDRRVMPWTEKHLPTTLEELFVQKKKVEEVKYWMERSIQTNNLCLISGPSGCGKTATVCLLAKHLGFELKEWINPLDLIEYRQVLDPKDFDPEEVRSKSQIDLFTEFLMKASTYPSLPIKGRPPPNMKKIILIEDIPNMFFRDNKLLQNILIKYRSNPNIRTPIVFIMADSDSVQSNMNIYKLFPKETIDETRLVSIQFNPVTTPMMTKFLATICPKEEITFSKEDLEDIALISDGDIRNAINTLQFKAQPNSLFAPTKPKGVKRTKGKTLKEKGAQRIENLGSTYSKDDDLFLFRALGKVLYAKRREDRNAPIENKLKGELEKERRFQPLLESPEDIGNKIKVTTQTFSNFLFRNFPEFFTLIEDVSRVSSALADSDLLLSKWIEDGNNTTNSRGFKNSNLRDEIALSIVNRSIMHSNSARAPSKFRPLNKPFDDEKYIIEKRMVKAREAFSEILSLKNEELVDLTSIPVQVSEKLTPRKREILDEVRAIKKPRLGP